MQRRWLVVSLLVIGLVVPIGSSGVTAQQDCGFPVTMTDATGTEVTVDEEPFRVVTLSPSAAQIMWEIGARQKVVGVTKYADYLEGVETRTVVSTGEAMVSNERVVALEPDLVLAPHVTPNATVEKLRDAGLTVYYFPAARTIEDVYDKVRTVGRLTGECAGAEATVAWMQERIGVVGEAVKGQARPDVLYHFYGYTAGKGTFIDEIIQTAGGNNIATDVNISWYQPINAEVVVEQDPDWIILNSDDPAVPKTAAFNGTTAVQAGQVLTLPVHQLNQPAPRIVHSITTLAKDFHPEAYAEANATATPTPTASPTETVDVETVGVMTRTVTETPVSTDTSGQPGFGVVLTLVVVVLLGGVRSRRD